MEEDQRLRKRVFIDTNIILSGVFFSGNDSKVLSLMDIDLFTSDLAIEEAKEVIRRKYGAFGNESCKIALEELENAVMDFAGIIQKKYYSDKIHAAKKLIDKEKDSKILAAALTINPDYFITGDSDFFKPEVKKLINVCKTKDVLRELGL